MANATSNDAPAGDRSDVRLDQCDREPIHVPGAIQPHGVLLVVDPGTGIILGDAGPVDLLLGYSGSPIGQTLGRLIGRSLAELAPNIDLRVADEPVYIGALRPGPPGIDLDMLAHVSGDRIVIEIEPALGDRPSASRLFARMRGAANRMRGCADYSAAFAAAAAEIREITGFDRVLVYRFLPDFSGEIVAESRVPEMDSFLGARFPASDVPRQARALYLRNIIRVIPDARYEPAPLQGVAADLDMSDCALRSVSPVHLEYLANMSVRASMSVSLVRDGQLWGLIACHNATPRLVPFETREASKHVADELMRHHRKLEVEADSEAQRAMTHRIDALITRIGGRADVPAGIADVLAEVADTFEADGILLRTADLTVTAGPLAIGLDADGLIANLYAIYGDGVHAIADLEAADPGDRWRQGREGGLLVVCTGGIDPIALVLLRRRIPETVRWAGSPIKVADANGALSPRRSFALWLEEHRGLPKPWRHVEIDAAERFVRQIERLVRQHRITTLQAEIIHVSRVSAMGALASTLAHELNQPLTALANFSRGVANLLSTRREQGIDGALEYLEQMGNAAVRAGQVVKRLRTMVGKSPVQRVRVQLDQVVEDAVSLALPDAHVRKIDVRVDIPADANRVVGDAVQIEQVLTNLIRNAAEAMEAVEARRLAISAAPGDRGFVEVRVADSGPGLSDDAREKLFAPFSSSKVDGMGLGLSICRTIVERHGGRIWAEPGNGPGTAFRFTLPMPGRVEEGRRPSPQAAPIP